MSERGLHIEANMPLSRFTTIKVGGPARYYAHADSLQAIRRGVAWAREHSLPLLILGGGSNLLIADRGFPGLVLRLNLRGVEYALDGDAVQLVAAAGENWHRLVSLTVEHNWAGLECLAGIPGQVGASPIQNVGAYGQEVQETITFVEVFDIESGEVRVLPNADCGFGYRDSRFKTIDRGRYIVLKVAFRLIQGGAPAVRYSELNRHFGERRIAYPTLSDVKEAVLTMRRYKSMLLNARDPNSRSVGSFFTNPIVSEDEFNALLEIMAPQIRGERVPRFTTPEGRVKVPAAWLIEHAGYLRGYTQGKVGLSVNHALAVVNRGGATAQEVIAFARQIRNRVRDLFGITLVPEPTLVGLSLDDDLAEGAHAA